MPTPERLPAPSHTPRRTPDTKQVPDTSQTPDAARIPGTTPTPDTGRNTVGGRASAQSRLASAQRQLTAAYRRQLRGEARAQREDAEAATARAVTSLAMQAAELSLASGASTARSISLVRRLAGRFDLPVHVDITYTHIALSYQPSVASDPITLMRVVRPGAIDYDRLGRVEHLIDRIVDEEIELADATAMMAGVFDDQRRYRSWVVLAGAGLLGAAVATLLGGGWADLLAAALATIGCELVRGGLASRGLSSFFAQAAAAAVPAAIGLAMMALRPQLGGAAPEVSPSLVVAAGMVSLLAGIGVVTAAGDAIDGHYISSAARMIEVVVMTGAIVAGLVMTLWFGLRLGVPAYIAPSGGLTTPPEVQLLCAGGIAFGYGVLCNMGPRSLLAATAMGVLSWAVYLAADTVTASSATRCALAAMVVGFCSRMLTRPLRIPVVAMVTTAIAPLMPGLALYRGVFALTAPASTPIVHDGNRLLMVCALTGLGLAAGSSLGSTLAGVTLRGVRHLGHRAPSRRDEARATGSSPA